MEHVIFWQIFCFQTWRARPRRQSESSCLPRVSTSDSLSWLRLLTLGSSVTIRLISRLSSPLYASIWIAQGHPLTLIHLHSSIYIHSLTLIHLHSFTYTQSLTLIHLHSFTCIHSLTLTDTHSLTHVCTDWKKSDWDLALGSRAVWDS